MTVAGWYRGCGGAWSGAEGGPGMQRAAEAAETRSREACERWGGGHWVEAGGRAGPVHDEGQCATKRRLRWCAALRGGLRDQPPRLHDVVVPGP